MVDIAFFFVLKLFLKRYSLNIFVFGSGGVAFVVDVRNIHFVIVSESLTFLIKAYQ